MPELAAHPILKSSQLILRLHICPSPPPTSSLLRKHNFLQANANKGHQEILSSQTLKSWHAVSRRTDCRLPANKKKCQSKGPSAWSEAQKEAELSVRAPSRTVLGFPRRPRTCTEELESLASWQPFPDPGRAQACQTGAKKCWRQPKTAFLQQKA